MDSPSPESVLFVVMDTVRKDRLSPYGYTRPTTPHLADFARDATVFEEAVAPAPWTLPVHASLFSGLYPSEHGADQETPYLHDVQTLAETLSAAGYDSACYSSNAWITPYTHLTDGFDAQDNFFEVMPTEFLAGPLATAWRILNDNERLRTVADKLVSLGNTAHEYFAGGNSADSKTPAVINKAQSYIRGRTQHFTFLNLMDAHLPYHPPQSTREEFAPNVDSAAVCQNSKAYNSGAREIDTDEWTDIRNLYDAEIAHIDSELGRLFSWLKSEGRWDETMVIVCADHGELHGEHDLYGHEFGLYDQLINVPLIIKHPDLSASHRTDQVELLDLYHTILDALTVPADAFEATAKRTRRFDPTRSLLRDEYRAFETVTNPDPGQRGPAGRGYIEYSQPVVELNQLEEKAHAADITLDQQSRFYSRMRAVRTPEGKYVRIDRIPDEAYRLDTDPTEITNRAQMEDPVLETLEADLATFEEAVGGAWTHGVDMDASDDGVSEMDAEAQERLRDLGYLE